MLQCKRNVCALVQFAKPKRKFLQYSRQIVVSADGQRSYKVSVEDKPFVERGFQTSDFSVSAILASGAVNLLTPQYPLSLGIDYVEQQISDFQSVEPVNS